MKRKLLFAACCAALLAVPVAVNSQQPGDPQVRQQYQARIIQMQAAQAQPAQQPGGDTGGGGRGGRGGRGPGGMMGGDPMQFFDFIAKGKDVIRRDDLDPNFQRMFDGMAARMGVTNGQISRDQFKTMAESFGNRGRGGPGGQGGLPGGGRGADMTAEDMDRQAENAFRKADKDGDGLLQYTEMPDNLKPVWEKYDANKDGSINLEEFKTYYRDRMQLRIQENAAAQGQTPNGQPAAPDGLPPAAETESIQDEDKRPTVYRYGKLPKELPPWFTDLDTNKDGQIWLSSWVKSGRSVEDFRAMDRNDDGLLTVDEYLGYVRANTKQSPGDTVLANANGDGGRTAFGGFVGFGGPGGMQGFGGGGRGGRGGAGGGMQGFGGGGMQGFGGGGDPASAGGAPGGGRGGRGGPGGGNQGGGFPGGGGRGNRGGGGGPGSAGGADAQGNPAAVQTPGQYSGGGGRGGRGGRAGGGPGSGKNGGGNNYGGGVAPVTTGNAPKPAPP